MHGLSWVQWLSSVYKSNTRRRSNAMPLTVNYENKAFRVQGRLVEGLHPVLSSTFYPFYTFERAKFGPKLPHKARASRGVKAGTVLDNELKDITFLLNQVGPTLLLRHFYETDLALPAHLPETDRQHIQQKRRSIRRDTMRICRILDMDHLRPVGAQFPVGHELLRVGTAVDLVCVDTSRDNQVVLVEIKCGFAWYYEKHTEWMMQPPFQDKHDSPHNQHQLQLALTRVLYSRTTGRPLDQIRSVVYRTQNEGVAVYPLEDWALARSEQMQLAIAARNNRVLAYKSASSDSSSSSSSSTEGKAQHVAGTFLAMSVKPRSRDKTVEKKKKSKKTPANGVDLKKIKRKKQTRTKKMVQRVIQSTATSPRTPPVVVRVRPKQ